MRKTYIATTQEAKALHDGTQTAIIVKHSNKQPYALGQEVVVREAWIKLTPNHIIDSQFVYKSQMCQESEEIRQEYISIGYPYTWNSPATMPVSAARTRFRIVSCEAVRVRKMIFEDAVLICNPLDYKEYIIHKLGQSAWDNNDYVFYYKIERV